MFLMPGVEDTAVLTVRGKNKSKVLEGGLESCTAVGSFELGECMTVLNGKGISRMASLPRIDVHQACCNEGIWGEGNRSGGQR